MTEAPQSIDRCLERYTTMARDPIDLFGARLVSEGILGPNDAAEVLREVQAEIDAAADRAAAAPFPTLEETRAYVYAD